MVTYVKEESDVHFYCLTSLRMTLFLGMFGSISNKHLLVSVSYYQSQRTRWNTNSE